MMTYWGVWLIWHKQGEEIASLIPDLDTLSQEEAQVAAANLNRVQEVVLLQVDERYEAREVTPPVTEAVS